MQSVILPGTVEQLNRRTEPSVIVYRLRCDQPYTDAALKAYVGCDDYLGGYVERFADNVVEVRRHTS
ncbi:MAG TPA: hypothetical protein VJU83_09620 [Burkholderiales bacterium]|nr:hypothetical protein [Burkholderiales bacterium]